jgi:hypothetical protein
MTGRVEVAMTCVIQLAALACHDILQHGWHHSERKPPQEPSSMVSSSHHCKRWSHFNLFPVCSGFLVCIPSSSIFAVYNISNVHTDTGIWPFLICTAWPLGRCFCVEKAAVCSRDSNPFATWPSDPKVEKRDY